MPIERTTLKRVFIYSGVRLQDPDPAMTPTEVRDLYAASGRPELSSAQVNEPELVNDEYHYVFHRAVGTKAGPIELDEDLPFIPVPNDIAQSLQAFGINSQTKHVGFMQSAAIVLANEGRRCVTPPSSLIPWMH